MRKVKKIKVLAFARMQAVFASLVGLLAGVLYSFGGLAIDTMVTLGWIVSSETPGLSYGTLLAFLALPVMPLFFAALGFILGVVEALLYNFFAKRLGGIRIEF